MEKRNHDTSLLVGIGLGQVLGLAIGGLIHNVPVGFAVGSFIGLVLGAFGAFPLRSW
ncbi:hypothetical protein [Lacticaseibacillus pantheris]|jgi:hypothetical protein|uniref:Uncharacterized protein n=1 Tax=Lacticaseibacillus pantheris DSM 15945 = JCM 12539 = NBRC 106106 TaxID=1423783 RepID=A0A0R1U0K4_9LACO|nr:hypothetical protein [Lacticaseibacillus pantheris]KRL86929.1 hypothetical protein FC50_GL000122 [Lacticaseibacillus pantheris DSM 15945 = JCM 12539 = NBRC 106106]WKF85309.1 hypothetical protein QY874_01550 [Lacticaseibacillus pantheris]